jgi:hypothetical protein
VSGSLQDRRKVLDRAIEHGLEGVMMVFANLKLLWMDPLTPHVLDQLKKQPQNTNPPPSQAA